MSNSPRAVLTAVDFGEASARAIGLGGFIARACGGTLRLMHAEIVEAPPYFTTEQIDALDRQRQAVRAQAEQFLTRFGRQHTSTPFAAVVDDRPAVDAILHESLTADLVVMGTHGRHGPSRWWLGSVAERVLRDVARPLLITHADASRPVESLFARVLVHAAGQSTLEYARTLAAPCRGQVFDGRQDPIEPAVERTGATLLVVAMPQPRTPAWLSHQGEPLVRFCKVPILFVPEVTGGITS